MADNTFNFDLDAPAVPTLTLDPAPAAEEKAAPVQQEAPAPEAQVCLLYTSDAADEEDSVDLGGRRVIIKKKKKKKQTIKKKKQEKPA